MKQKWYRLQYRRGRKQYKRSKNDTISRGSSVDEGEVVETVVEEVVQKTQKQYRRSRSNAGSGRSSRIAVEVVQKKQTCRGIRTKEVLVVKAVVPKIQEAVEEVEVEVIEVVLTTCLSLCGAEGCAGFLLDCAVGTH